MLILGIESSCDETSTAVVEMSSSVRRILSNRIASSMETHRLFGGVVPEIASRAHAEAISGLTYDALSEAGVTMEQIDAVGVTAFPGLIGALMVGVNFAKSLAYANEKPLVPVNHVYGHVAASYLAHPTLEPPFLALIVSGGHTSLTYFTSYTQATVLGRTRDDAAGEAFDKVGRVLGVPYPGGAEMDRLATSGDPSFLSLPSAALREDAAHPSLDFSFSGLKTAVINELNTANMKGLTYAKEDIAASFTAAVVGALVHQLEAAVDRTDSRRIVLAGGVAANSHLRSAVERLAARRNLQLFLPPRALCGDNAAMIGAQAYYEYLAGVRAGTDLTARATV